MFSQIYVQQTFHKPRCSPIGAWKRVKRPPPTGRANSDQKINPHERVKRECPRGIILSPRQVITSLHCRVVVVDLVWVVFGLGLGRVYSCWGRCGLKSFRVTGRWIAFTMQRTPWTKPKGSLPSDRIKYTPKSASKTSKSKGNGKQQPSSEPPKSRDVQTFESLIQAVRDATTSQKDPKGGCFCLGKLSTFKIRHINNIIFLVS